MEFLEDRGRGRPDPTVEIRVDDGALCLSPLAHEFLQGEVFFFFSCLLTSVGCVCGERELA